MGEISENTRDGASNTAYVAFKSVGAGEVARTVPVGDENGTITLVVDVSTSGQVLGIEFLDAESQLLDVPEE